MSAKKVLVFVASPRKKETWQVAQQFGSALQNATHVEIEYIFLGDCTIEQCCGCFL